MFDYYKIRSLHIELTDKCNAHCSMCGRNENGGIDKNFIQNIEINLKKFKQFFPNSFIDQLEQIRFCGNYGDPLMATELLEICQHIKAINSDIIIKINTNGSLRSTTWWKSLAETFTIKKDEVLFAIDGLADTHSIYRAGTQFQKVLDNAQAFIQTGGNASWIMLVFEHNEHQVEQCKKIADEYGFKHFRIKRTKRFFDSQSLSFKNHWPIKNKKGEVISHLRPPQKVEYQHQYQSETSKPTDWQKYFFQTDIECKAIKEQSLYLDANGNISPCCWLGAQIKHEKYRGINLNKQALRDYLEAESFNNELVSRWQPGDGRCKTCARICGKDFKPFDAQLME